MHAGYFPFPVFLPGKEKKLLLRRMPLRRDNKVAHRVLVERGTIDGNQAITRDWGIDEE